MLHRHSSTRILICLALIVNFAASLADTFNVLGPAVSIPSKVSETNTIFNVSTVRNVLSIGESQMLYMRWFSFDGIGSGQTTGRSATAAFYVTVDDYSQLVIPDSFNSLIKALL